MATVPLARIFASSTIGHIDELVLVRGWVFRLRTLASTTFLVVRDRETTVLVGVLGFRRHMLRRAFAQAGIAVRERWAWSVPVSSLYRRSERRHLR